MKKILTVVSLLLVMSTACYGAVSEDMGVYVRKDVYEVYMRNMNANMERIISRLDSLEGKMTEISDKLSALSERLDGNTRMLSSRIDGLDARMGDQQNYIYLVLVILGIIVALPTVQKMLQGRGDSKSTITLEDVKRLIEENNVKVLGKPQV